MRLLPWSLDGAWHRANPHARTNRSDGMAAPHDVAALHARHHHDTVELTDHSLEEYDRMVPPGRSAQLPLGNSHRRGHVGSVGVGAASKRPEWPGRATDAVPGRMESTMRRPTWPFGGRHRPDRLRHADGRSGWVRLRRIDERNVAPGAAHGHAQSGRTSAGWP